MVTAVFGSGFSETLVWADTGPGSGGVFGAGWSLTQSGDTYNSPWTFTNDRSSDPLVELILDGTSAFTVFDRTFNNVEGTPGSAHGRDFSETPTLAGVALYSHPVVVGAAPPVGDLWHKLALTLEVPVLEDFSFYQDTD